MTVPFAPSPQFPIRDGLASSSAFALAREVIGPGGGERFRRQPEGPVGADAVTFYKSVGTAVQARAQSHIIRARAGSVRAYEQIRAAASMRLCADAAYVTQRQRGV